MNRYARTFDLRWSDADANGHIRHTVYAELCVEARMAFLRDAGFDWKKFAALDLGPVLLREELQYFREIGLGERIEVDVAVLGLSPDGGRWTFRHEIRKADGELAARVEVTGGWIDLAARRLRLPPEELAAVMAAAPRSGEFRELPPLKRDRGDATPS